MARKTDLQDLVEQFVDSLSSLIEQDTVSRARDAVLTAFGGHAPSGSLLRGAGNGAGGARKRRKGPIQLCPVPGCSNRAAPVFGMVCAKHKDLSKADIKKYREQRRVQKAKAAKKAA